MKKTFIALGVLLFSVNSFAEQAPASIDSKEDQTPTITAPLAPIEKGVQYVVLPTNPSPDKEVIEFFSFNCPSCYRFETKYHGAQLISKDLPEGVKFKRYHLEDFGPLAKELAQAWAIANVLGIQDKASDAFYQAIQEERSIKSADDIKAVFLRLGVDSKTFDETKDNFLVKAFMAQQTDAIKELKPNSIPSVIVNRKFYVNSKGLNISDEQAFINDYLRVTSFLVGLDPKTEN
ncbi:DsbA family protein [Gilliamella sp. CG35]|uniref:DsbA family protein n=1 Tax=Gilliamella sp. CG35 TaxID=3351507 RepID=UPI0039877706